MGFDTATAFKFAGMFIPGAQPFAIAAQIVPESVRTFPFNLLGGLPRGDLQKFNRTIYPALLAKAQTSNGIAAAWWFGEIILVRADGSVDTVARNIGPLSVALSALRTLADRMGQVIWVFMCPAGIDFEVPTQVSSRCRFDAFGTLAQVSAQVPAQRDPGETEIDLSPDPVVIPSLPAIAQAGIVPLSSGNVVFFLGLGLGFFLLLRR